MRGHNNHLKKLFPSEVITQTKLEIRSPSTKTPLERAPKGWKWVESRPLSTA